MSGKHFLFTSCVFWTAGMKASSTNLTEGRHHPNLEIRN
jgi:hypothetical protein